MKQIKAHRLRAGDTIQFQGVSARVRAIERLVDRRRVYYSLQSVGGRETVLQAQQRVILVARSS